MGFKKHSNKKSPEGDFLLLLFVFLMCGSLSLHGREGRVSAINQQPFFNNVTVQAFFEPNQLGLANAHEPMYLIFSRHLYMISHVPPAHANSLACSVSSVRS